MTDSGVNAPIPPPARGPAAHSAEEVRREVWHSLVSMLRVYSYAAGLDHGPIRVTDTSGGGVIVRSNEGELELHFDEQSGEARWERRGGEGQQVRGTFTLLADGRLDFDGEEKQLDSAAIEWVEDLTRPAGGMLAKQ